jgi:(E)-4-hydroxy-3-methylbut-2-enyl-diphosphate synthase
MRLKTPVIKIGAVKIGGTNPIAIQSMTNTNTSNVNATVKQCMKLADAGAEIVRLTVPDEAAAKAVPKIRARLDADGYENLPLVGDFHFNGHVLLEKYPECAATLDKYRINPGNVGRGKFKDENFEKIIAIAKKNKKPIRIGVNGGSTNGSMVESALSSAKFAEKLGMKSNQIVLSVKSSNIKELIEMHELLIKKMKTPYAIHLGLTEAGSGIQGTVSSAAALAVLLQKGIGDTIRVSVTDRDRTREVEICKQILQALDLRHFGPHITSCPGCGRANNKLFLPLAKRVTDHINKNFPNARLHIAIMGCIVNGPGEAANADIALVLPGIREPNLAAVYIKGKKTNTLKGKNIPQQFIKILNQHLNT